MSALQDHQAAKRQHRATVQRLIRCPGIDPAGCDSLIDGDRLAICSGCRAERARRATKAAARSLCSPSRAMEEQ